MTSTNKSKGEDEIDFNVVFLICEFQFSSMHVTLVEISENVTNQFTTTCDL